MGSRLTDDWWRTAIWLREAQPRTLEEDKVAQATNAAHAHCQAIYNAMWLKDKSERDLQKAIEEFRTWSEWNQRLNTERTEAISNNNEHRGSRSTGSGRSAQRT